jgi:broad specificity phosphatase PhoE
VGAVTTIYLIRHGKAEAGWSEQRDPGLDDTGRRQAESAARALHDLGPLPILVSPLRRARETASEFEMLWRRPATVEGRVAEIPSQGMTLDERADWLKSLTRQRWDDLDDVVQSWRRAAIQCLLEISTDSVVVSHFMIINAVVSWARGDGNVVCCHPLPGSRTTLRRDGDGFQVVELGAEGPSTVL